MPVRECPSSHDKARRRANNWNQTRRKTHFRITTSCLSWTTKKRIPQLPARRFLHVETRMVGQKQPQEQPDEERGSHTNTMTPRRFACKRLAKGVVFQNNVLYAPLSRTQLQTEITCLRVLQGRHQCLGLHRVFETRTEFLLVTDLCSQGHLLQFLKRYSSGSGGADTTHAPSSHCSETSSLILPVSMLLALAHQLLDAIRHCAKHGIIHRDIKPQNCLISSSSSPPPQDHQPPPPVDYPIVLTLADFGSSALHPPTHSSSSSTTTQQPQQVDLPFHSTFVGSSLYRSPEMSHRPRCYNQKTDVWSAGVVLSVAAMGYPHTHNVLRTSSGKSPVSPFRDQTRFSGSLLGDVVNACLIRDMEQRPNAHEILDTYQVWLWQDKQQQQQDERTTEP